jgi:DNA-binding MarR family transcriptional regulator
MAAKRLSLTDLMAGLSSNWPEMAARLSLAILAIYRAQEYLFDDLQQCLVPFGLQPAELDVLVALRSQGGPHQLTPTVLYRSLLLSSGGLTKILRRLETAGLVERLPNPQDRRSRFVRLTPLGRGRVERASVAVLDHEQRFLVPLSAAERATLTALLERLLQALGG